MYVESSKALDLVVKGTWKGKCRSFLETPDAHRYNHIPQFQALFTGQITRNSVRIQLLTCVHTCMKCLYTNETLAGFGLGYVRLSSYVRTTIYFLPKFIRTFEFRGWIAVIRVPWYDRNCYIDFCTSDAARAKKCLDWVSDASCWHNLWLSRFSLWSLVWKTLVLKCYTSDTMIDSPDRNVEIHIVIHIFTRTTTKTKNIFWGSCLHWRGGMRTASLAHIWCSSALQSCVAALEDSDRARMNLESGSTPPCTCTLRLQSHTPYQTWGYLLT